MSFLKQLKKLFKNHLFSIDNQKKVIFMKIHIWIKKVYIFEKQTFFIFGIFLLIQSRKVVKLPSLHIQLHVQSTYNGGTHLARSNSGASVCCFEMYVADWSPQHAAQNFSHHTPAATLSGETKASQMSCILHTNLVFFPSVFCLSRSRYTRAESFFFHMFFSGIQNHPPKMDSETWQNLWVKDKETNLRPYLSAFLGVFTETECCLFRYYESELPVMVISEPVLVKKIPIKDFKKFHPRK